MQVRRAVRAMDDDPRANGDHLTAVGARDVVELMRNGKTIHMAHPMDGQHQWSWRADNKIVHSFMSVEI